MINLRYHIVSITAVFLALGIGLTLGSTFLDRVTVDTLEAQLDDVEEQVERTEADNAELRSTLGDLEARNQALQEALPERVLAGHLEGVPVLVMATEGTDTELVQDAVTTLAAAGAEVSGTWWLTERWALDDAEEVTDLSRLLDVATEDPDRLWRNAAIRLAELLNRAAAPPAQAAGGEDGGAASDPAANPAPAPEPEEPTLVAALEEAGFVEYESLDRAAEAGGVRLPAADARFVVVSSTADPDGAQMFATALIDEVSADGPVPVVAAQGQVGDADDPGGLSEEERRTTFVGPIRDGELTGERVSTVDHLDTAAGHAALVLAVEDLAELVIGHYGVAPGAARLVPGPTAAA